MSFNTFTNFLAHGWNLYEKALQRNSGDQILAKCENDTSCFFRDGEWMGESGHRTGKCGTRKDHRRVYVCRTCYNNGKRP